MLKRRLPKFNVKMIDNFFVECTSCKSIISKWRIMKNCSRFLLHWQFSRQPWTSKVIVFVCFFWIWLIKMSEWVLLACSRGSKREFVSLFSWYLGQGILEMSCSRFSVDNGNFGLFLHNLYDIRTFLAH